MQEIRHNSRRQHEKNQFYHRVSKVGCLVRDYVESPVANGFTFRATGGRCRTIGHFSGVNKAYATNVCLHDDSLLLLAQDMRSSVLTRHTAGGKLGHWAATCRREDLMCYNCRY